MDKKTNGVKMKKKETRILSSINLTTTLIKYFPERIIKIYITENKNEKLKKLIKKRGLDYTEVKNPLTQDKKGIHQHVWIEALPFKYYDPEDLVNLKRILILDQVSDPYNFGSVARTAYQMGFEAIIIQNRNSVDVTPTVSRVSTGGIEFLKVVRVVNIRKTMQFLKENEFTVYTLDAKGDPLSNIKFSDKTVLIIGNEGKGVRYQIKQESDKLISIPMVGKLDSLNLSNAFAIAAWEANKDFL